MATVTRMPVPKGFVRIAGSDRHIARGAKRVADADPGELLTVTIRVRRRPDGPPMPSLDDLAKIPLNRRKFPSREEFAERHGASAQDFAAVAAFATSHGLRVTEQHAGQRTMLVAGSVKQMEAAFGVKLGHYTTPTETYRGREGFVHVPEALSDIVESVLGLDNRRAVRPHFKLASSSPHPDGAPSPQNNPPAGASLLTPPQVAGLYNFPTNSAAGQTVAILEFGGGYSLSDVTAFLSPLGIATPSIIDQSVDGGSNSPAGSLTNFTVTDPDLEVIVDIDVVASVAIGANIVMYFAANTDQAFADAVSQAVHDSVHAPTIISCSWAGSEDGWTGSARTAMVKALNDAAALGVTVFFTSGDQGSDDNVGDGSAHIEYPGAEYGGICCGGTYIANVSGSSFTEGTWNDNGATGGGVSNIYGLPAWQDNIGVPKSANNGTTVGRGVPDISGNASPASGYNPTLYGTLLSNLAITSGPQAGNFFTSVGGTSVVAPLYAGLLALIEAQIGEPLGYLTPLLYAPCKTTAPSSISTMRPTTSGPGKQSPRPSTTPDPDGMPVPGSAGSMAANCSALSNRSMPSK
jgi:kumamolisin